MTRIFVYTYPPYMIIYFPILSYPPHIDNIDTYRHSVDYPPSAALLPPSPIHLPIHPLIHPSTHLPTYPLIHPSTHSPLTHPNHNPLKPNSPASASKIQRLLPPQTPRVSIRIHHLTDSRRIEIDLLRPGAIHGKHRNARPTRHAIDSETGDVLLQRDGNGVVQHGAGHGPVEEGVGHVLAVQRGADGELVGEGAIEEGAVEVVGVAGEGGVGEGEDGALEVGGVAVGAGEDGRVEHVLDVGGHGGLDVGEIGGEEGVVGGVVGDGRVGEEQAFVRVVADHDLDVLVEGALQQEAAGEGGREEAVDDGAEAEVAVRRREDLVRVGFDEGGRGQLAGLLDSADVQEREEGLEDLLLLI